MCGGWHPRGCTARGPLEALAPGGLLGYLRPRPRPASSDFGLPPCLLTCLYTAAQCGVIAWRSTLSGLHARSTAITPGCLAGGVPRCWITGAVWCCVRFGEFKFEAQVATRPGIPKHTSILLILAKGAGPEFLAVPANLTLTWRRYAANAGRGADPLRLLDQGALRITAPSKIQVPFPLAPLDILLTGKQRPPGNIRIAELLDPQANSFLNLRVAIGNAGAEFAVKTGPC